MTSTLELVLVMLVAAVIAVTIFRSLRMPPVIGYLLVGALLGPHAIGWIPQSEEAHYLAEFGVVFLMFSVGLEFSLLKLFTMRHIVFGFGSAQVGVVMLITMVIAILVGLDWKSGFALGGVLAMSSTAIVSKILKERVELDSKHGREIIGVLLFQDLAVVPLLIIIPALAKGSSNLTQALSIEFLKIALVLITILFFGQKLLRPWLQIIAKQRSKELFMLNLLLITLGLAWLTQLAKLPLALGAFLAGVLISETEYRYQVEDTIKPFRDMLLGLFFVTIGALLDVRTIINQFGLVLLFLMGPMIAKFILIFALSKFFGSSSGTAIRSGLSLAQCGEFGFVLLLQAGTHQLIDSTLLQPILAAMLLSMLIAPFLIQHSDKIALRLSSQEWLQRSMALTNIAVRSLATEKHVIICGYGKSGQYLARFIEREGIAYIALDLDPERVIDAAAAGESVVYGDATQRGSLIAAGLNRASALVISIAETSIALKILQQVREIRPDLPVIVRTHDETDVDKLNQAGAAEVVPESLEGSLMLASHVLILLGIPLNRVVKQMRAIHSQHYHLLRGIFRGSSDETDLAENIQARLHSVTLSKGAFAVNKTLAELNLAKNNIEVTALRRRNIRGPLPDPNTRLETGDVVVLLGKQEDLLAAENYLLRG